MSSQSGPWAVAAPVTWGIGCIIALVIMWHLPPPHKLEAYPSNRHRQLFACYLIAHAISTIFQTLNAIAPGCAPTTASSSTTTNSILNFCARLGVLCAGHVYFVLGAQLIAPHSRYIQRRAAVGTVVALSSCSGILAYLHFGLSNSAAQNSRVVPPSERMCCKAMTPSCLACAAGMTVAEWCAARPDHPFADGCPAAPAAANCPAGSDTKESGPAAAFGIGVYAAACVVGFIGILCVVRRHRRARDAHLLLFAAIMGVIDALFPLIAPADPANPAWQPDFLSRLLDCFFWLPGAVLGMRWLDSLGPAASGDAPGAGLHELSGSVRPVQRMSYDQ